ncbi:hypothetical protein J7J95_03390 [bacterium]|nr:hypothetical protein [bacterium]
MAARKRKARATGTKKSLAAQRTRCEVYSRIVGYLRPVSQWNPGKAEEFYKRTPYKIR